MDRPHSTLSRAAKMEMLHGIFRWDSTTDTFHVALLPMRMSVDLMFLFELPLDRMFHPHRQNVVRMVIDGAMATSGPLVGRCEVRPNNMLRYRDVDDFALPVSVDAADVHFASPLPLGTIEAFLLYRVGSAGILPVALLRDATGLPLKITSPEMDLTIVWDGPPHYIFSFP